MIGIIMGALAVAYFLVDDIKNIQNCDSKCNKCSQLDCPHRYR